MRHDVTHTLLCFGSERSKHGAAEEEAHCAFTPNAIGRQDPIQSERRDAYRANFSREKTVVCHIVHHGVANWPALPGLSDHFDFLLSVNLLSILTRLDLSIHLLFRLHCLLAQAHPPC